MGSMVEGGGGAGGDGMKRKRKKREEGMMGSADLLLQWLTLAMVESTNEQLGSLAQAVQEVGESLQQISSTDGGEEEEETEAEDLARELVDKGLLELLPSLLQHSCVEVAIGSAEIVGALAVSSSEINAKVVKARAVLKALTELLLWSTSRRDAGECCLAACHAIMDVAITPLGCSAIRQVPGLHQQLIGQCVLLPVSDAVVVAGELLDQVLVVANMVLHDNIELDFDTSEVLLSLQKLWKMTQHLPSVHGRKPMRLAQLERPLRSIDNWCTPENEHQLAKLIVQLAMQQRVVPPCEEVVTSTHLFGGREGIQLDCFLEEHWESSPLVTTMNLGLLEQLLGNGICLDSPAEFLKAVVYGMAGCPPAFADEVDPRIQYEGLESRLGEPPVYDQDVRLVKSEPGGNSPLEVHYFRNKGTTSFISAEDCVSAYRDGYTVVIRGMQFRFPEIAALSDALATQLGQVTVGANLYLTPPHSQGLVTHFDDHCVFVCQLVGHKQWKIYPPQQWLPRLYTFKALSQNTRNDPVAQYVLCEGDVLYIPRGFLHEAHTSCSSEKLELLDSLQNIGAEFSLHLSLGVEVEPAFEWEGLLHIALRLWSHQRQQQQSMYFTGDDKMEDLCEMLLHVAIRNTGNKTMTFRKAWVPLSSTAKQDLATPEDCSHSELMEEAFSCMLKDVREGADYHEAVKEYEGSLSSLNWLNQLSVGGLQLNYHTNELRAGLVEEAFRQMADGFVQEAAFQASIQEQRNLLRTFRKCRRKLTNAMLALHTYH
ncbi:unnamed protein product [Sphagnum troendelagicum]|uniref:Bifunctional lysine-specific demethylase and histidyl-hydroxylase n=1 Tax=Sphagnum troendelagicum TaxID=128251 RepID=A0ABP0UFB1_9BRYO